MSAREVATVALLCGGGALLLVATLGVTVMRDWQDRLHYVGVSSYGVLLIALAIVVRESFSLIGDKALVTAVILLIASPVLTHVTLRSGRIRSLGDWRRNVDEEVDQ